MLIILIVFVNSTKSDIQFIRICFTHEVIQTYIKFLKIYSFTINVNNSDLFIQL